MDVVWTEVEGSSWNRVLIPEIEEYLDKVDAEYHAKHATIPQGRHRRGSAPNRSARVPENPYPACGSDSGSRKLGERAKATGHAATITQVDNHCSTTQLPKSTPWFTQRETAATQLLQSPAGFFARSPSLFCEICAANCPAPAGFLARSPPPFLDTSDLCHLVATTPEHKYLNAALLEAMTPLRYARLAVTTTIAMPVLISPVAPPLSWMGHHILQSDDSSTSNWLTGRTAGFRNSFY
ncbi:hypothetical protein AX16_010013 [Volvariella volvacea WC 439]|nr:hypothetical protein AX16_010013 [Volvariella volvacea WC 439]